MRDAGGHQRDVGIADVLANLDGVSGARPTQPQSFSLQPKNVVAGNFGKHSWLQATSEILA
jgi:hypothetical protein